MEKNNFPFEREMEGEKRQAQDSPPSSPPENVASERKRRHKLTEQRGRQKINSQINELKDLLPECKYVITTKASVLECAINSLKRLQSVCNQLVSTNKKLQQENKWLRQELERIGTPKNMMPMIDPELDQAQLGEAALQAQDTGIGAPELPTTFTQPLPDDGFGFFDGIPRASDMESIPTQYLQRNNYFNNSPENSSPTNSSVGNSPPHYENNFLAPNTLHLEDAEEDPFSVVLESQGYKISKQKLFLMFLFLIPFFFSLDNINVGLSNAGTSVASTARTLMSNNFISIPQVTIGYYLEILRLLFYIFFGTMGLTWIANTILWFFKLESKDAKDENNSGTFFMSYSRVSL